MEPGDIKGLRPASPKCFLCMRLGVLVTLPKVTIMKAVTE